MRKNLLIVGASVAAVTALIAVLLVQPFSTREQAQAAELVNVGVTAAAPFEWTPSSLTVPAGTTVRWTTSGPAPHTVMSDGCGNSQYGACSINSGTVPLQTNTSKTSFEYTFDKPGSFPYYCSIHGTPGGVNQAGWIVVYAEGSVAGPTTSRGPGPELIQPKASVSLDVQSVAGDSATVRMSVSGAALRAPQSGVTDPAFGHFHLVLDKEMDFLKDAEFPRPGTDPNIFHVSENTFTLTGLKAGAHVLTLYWGYDNHFSPVMPISSSVAFTTGAAITPPATGDAGMATSQLPQEAVAGGWLLLLGGVGAMFERARRQES